jgi:hypothetical protein
LLLLPLLRSDILAFVGGDAFGSEAITESSEARRIGTLSFVRADAFGSEATTESSDVLRLILALDFFHMLPNTPVEDRPAEDRPVEDRLCSFCGASSSAALGCGGESFSEGVAVVASEDDFFQKEGALNLFFFFPFSSSREGTTTSSGAVATAVSTTRGGVVSVASGTTGSPPTKNVSMRPLPLISISPRECNTKSSSVISVVDCCSSCKRMAAAVAAEH